MKKIIIFVTVSCAMPGSFLFGMQQRKGKARQQAQQAQPKQSFELNSEETINWVSHKIDKRIVGHAKYCCCADFFNFVKTGYEFSQLTTADKVVQKLREIDMYTARMSKEQIVTLAQQNGFFGGLTSNAVAHCNTIKKSFINGSTLTQFLNPAELFLEKQLSPVLSAYLGEIVKKQCTLWQADELTKSEYVDYRIDELYSIDLRQAEYSLRKGSVKISANGCYVQAVDISDKTITWNIETGAQCQPINCTWLDVWYAKDGFSCTTYDHKYEIAIMGNFLRVYPIGMSRIANLCRIAFNNSENSDKELQMLSKSDVLKELTNFQKKCLQQAIQKKIQNNKS